MGKAIRNILIGSAVLACMGAGLFGVYAAENDRGTVTDTVSVDSFDKLDIDTSGTDIIIKEGSSNSVSYRVKKKREPVINENDGRLTVKTKALTTHFNFLSWDKEYIEITLDKDTLENVTLDTGSGDVNIEGISLGGKIKGGSGDLMLSGCRGGRDVVIERGSGDIKLEDCEFGKLSKEQGSGDLAADNVTADTAALKSSSGSTSLSSCNIGTIKHKSGSGDITGKDMTLDSTDIETSSGEVTLMLSGSESGHDYDLSASSGDIIVGGNKISNNYTEDNGAGNTIRVKTSSGDIGIDFN